MSVEDHPTATVVLPAAQHACLPCRSSAGMKLGERSSAPGAMGHLGSGPFDHMPMPDRDAEL